MAGDFTKEKMEWLEALAVDASLQPGAFRTAFLISQHVNRGTGDAWPSLNRLAALQGTDERTVRRYIGCLCAAGYLEKKRGGNGTPNRYRMTLPDRTYVSDLNTDRPDTSVHSETGSDEQTGHLCHSDRTSVSEQTGHQCPPNPLNEPFEEPFESISMTKPSLKEAMEEGFEEFWRQYPRKKAKGAARRAFEKARKTVSQPDLIIGVMRYAAACEGKDPQYIAHPATWLNAERWSDEIDVQPAGQSTLGSIFEAMRFDSTNDPRASVCEQSATQERRCRPELLKAFADDPDTTEKAWALTDNAQDLAVRMLARVPNGKQQARDLINSRARMAA